MRVREKRRGVVPGRGRVGSGRGWGAAYLRQGGLREQRGEEDPRRGVATTRAVRREAGGAAAAKESREGEGGAGGEERGGWGGGGQGEQGGRRWREW
jgi:hypothetical protein